MGELGAYCLVFQGEMLETFSAPVTPFYLPRLYLFSREIDKKKTMCLFECEIKL